MHSLARGFLLIWSGSFVDEKEKRLGRLLCYVCYGPYGGSKIGEPSIIVKAYTK